MKHSLKVTAILIVMFFLTQMVGLFVIHQYSPQTSSITDVNGNTINATTFNLPYGMDPPSETEPKSTTDLVLSFAIIFSIAVIIMLILMKYNADVLIRLWFFLVVTLALGVSLSSVLVKTPILTQTFPSFLGTLKLSSLLAIIVALPLAFFKIYKRNLIVHNITEVLVYPGIAAIFVALIYAWTSSPILTVSVILILISFYDMYAVWRSGFMQKMAKYQIQNLKIFTGFFVPYLGKKQRETLKKAASSKSKKIKEKKVKVNIAILGGGDVVFPIILAGVVLFRLGFLSALIISLGATFALAGLFYMSEKGKFYPAMPFISAGCFVGLIIAYLI